MPAYRVTLLAAVVASTLSAPAWSDGMEPAHGQSRLRVDYDQATAIHLDKPAKTVVVGNASIAEALLVNARTIYVQGRLFGNTNVIALDAEGAEIINTQVTVGAPDIAQVTLYRGPGIVNQHNLACAPRCERTLTLGDADVDPQIKNGTSKMEAGKSGTDLSSPR
jgi:hypothetical protein